MEKFIILLWDDQAPQRRERARLLTQVLEGRPEGWTTALDASGLRVLRLRAGPNAPVPAAMEGAEGLVIGRLFRRGCEREGELRRLCANDAEKIIATGGQHLTRTFWGAYVAIWKDPGQRMTCLFRDPCGSVPCYVMRTDALSLVFSHVEDIADLPGLRFTIDWAFLRAFLKFNYFVTPHTALNEVEELLPGQKLDWRLPGRTSLSWLWNGARIAEDWEDKSFEDQKARLRSIAEDCFTALVGKDRTILVRLSGGLDSTIVLALARRCAAGRVAALHLVGRDYENQEAVHAQLAARHAGVELLKVEPDLKSDLADHAAHLPRLVRPDIQSLAAAADQAVFNAARQIGVDAIMTGLGGDNLFLQRGVTRRILTDYLRLRGLDSGFLSAAYDAATLQQRSIWSLVYQALADRLSGRCWRPYDCLEADEPYLERTLAPPPLDYCLHPWLAEASRLPPGKADHLANIIALYRYYPVAGHALVFDALIPFFSQPILELMLRTPTFVLSKGGLDRALERCAFEDLIPPSILRRTQKGAVNLQQLRATEHNLSYIRELLLDGVLQDKGWLSRETIEAMLARDQLAHGGRIASVYLLLAVEIWLHAWRSAQSWRSA